MNRQPDAHESYAVAAGKLHWIALTLALSLLAIVLLVYAWARPMLRAGVQPARPVPPQPRLQPDPAADIAAVRALQRARLHGYAWADDRHTVARIPIERAMALLVAGGKQGDPRSPGASGDAKSGAGGRPANAASAGQRP